MKSIELNEISFCYKYMSVYFKIVLIISKFSECFRLVTLFRFPVQSPYSMSVCIFIIMLHVVIWRPPSLSKLTSINVIEG